VASDDRFASIHCVLHFILLLSPAVLDSPAELTRVSLVEDSS
jgi:hypothetical protein